MKVFSQCRKCSYEEVAKLYTDEINYTNPNVDICIADQYEFLKQYSIFSPSCTLLGDSLASPFRINFRTNYPFYVASEWNYKYWKEAGFNVKGIVKRPIINFQLQEEKKYLFITVGQSRYFDRKNIILIDRITRELGVRDKTIIIGKVESPRVLKNGRLERVDYKVKTDYETFTLSRYELHKLMAQAKYYLAFSVSEGVGLPPIEAQQYGVIPVYIDAHGYHENLHGIKISVKDEYDITIDFYPFRVWEPDEREIRNVIEDLVREERK